MIADSFSRSSATPLPSRSRRMRARSTLSLTGASPMRASSAPAVSRSWTSLARIARNWS